MRQLGELNESDYIGEGTSTIEDDMTSTIDDNVRKNFAQLGYSVSNSLIDYDSQSFESLLTAGNLLYVRGEREDKDSGKRIGHAWLADGAYKLSVHSTMWVRPINSLEWQLHTDFGTTSTEYIHYNWGFDGNCNGFFKLGIFGLNNEIDYDNPDWPYSNNLDRNYKFNVMFFTVTR